MTEIERAKLNRLLDALRHGDACALDGVYALVSRQMFALSRSLVGDRQTAEDIVSDSFIKLAENIGKFKMGTNGYAWVMKITRNTALDFLRKKGRRCEENIDDYFNLSSGDYEQDKRDTAIMLEMAIKSLSEVDKKLIFYVYYMDMTVREIATEMDIPKSTVARKIRDAEANLKKILKK